MACCSFKLVVLQAVALAAAGVSIGLVDSVRRPITLNARVAEEFVAPVKPAGQPSSSPGTDTKPAMPTSVDSSHTSAAATPAPAPDPPASADGLKPGNPGWKPTLKAVLPKGQITLDEAKQAFDGGASFIDARRKEEYEAGHIQGAIRINLKSFENGDPPLLAMVPRESMVIVYCGGGKCDESERVAEMLNNSGYKKVFVVHDGFPGWKAMGWPVETGEGMQ